MTETLRECPFCGAEGIIWPFREHPFYLAICKDGCGCQLGDFKTREEAMQAWNTRAERTCELIEHGSLANWPDMVCWSCSECGFGWHHSRNDKQFSYCPNCGRRVVNNDNQ